MRTCSTPHPSRALPHLPSPLLPLPTLLPQVVATEVSKSSVAAAKRNFELNGVSNVFVARMASEEFTGAWHEKRPMKR